MPKPKQHKGKLSIVRVRCTDCDDFIEIALNTTTHKVVAKVRLSLISFTDAIFGLGDVPCEFAVYQKGEIT